MRLKKMIFTPTLAALAMALGLSAAWADAPNLLTYQGRILESGVLVTGSRNVTISICNALTGGSCDSTGTQSVSVNNGLFRTTFTAPTSGPNTLFGAGNRYLEVNVGGTVLSPREQLTSSPFAAVAGSVPATGIAGGTLTVTMGGNVGIGTTNPQSVLQVSGNYLQIPVTSGANPAPADCDVAAEAGRLVVRSDGGAGQRLWVCLGAGGWVGF